MRLWAPEYLQVIWKLYLRSMGSKKLVSASFCEEFAVKRVWSQRAVL